MTTEISAAQTVGSTIDRLLVQWLSPPDGQFVQATLGTDVVDGLAQSVQFGQFLIPEDEELMIQGSVIEMDRELMRVTG